MSDTRELDDVFDELPPNVQQELQALEEIVYQQKQQLAELKTECDKLVDRDSAIIWLRAERDHRRQERDKAQQQLAELREAASKYSGDKGHAKWCVGLIDDRECSCGLTELAALLQESAGR